MGKAAWQPSGNGCSLLIADMLVTLEGPSCNGVMRNETIMRGALSRWDQKAVVRAMHESGQLGNAAILLEHKDIQARFETSSVIPSGSAHRILVLFLLSDQ